MFSASKNTVACLLLSNRYVPLALTLLGPVIVNILSFHMRLRATARPFVRSRTTPERTTSSARPEAQGEKQAAPAQYSHRARSGQQKIPGALRAALERAEKVTARASGTACDLPAQGRTIKTALLSFFRNILVGQ
jgi:hypothetical protein